MSLVNIGISFEYRRLMLILFYSIYPTTCQSNTVLVLGVLLLVDEPTGETSVVRRLERGVRAPVGTGRSGIVKMMF